MYYDLRSNIPVVIIEVKKLNARYMNVFLLLISSSIKQGSGRAADFFNRSLSYTKEVENDVNDRKTVYGIDELTVADIKTTEPGTTSHRQNQDETSESNAG